MTNVQLEKRENIVITIMKGIILSFFTTLISIFIFSAILTYTNVSEGVVPIVIIVLTFTSILIGTIISIRKISRNGMMNGAIIGGVYVVLLYLISSILNTGFIINAYTIGMVIAGIVSGIIGGIIGVNT